MAKTPLEQRLLSELAILKERMRQVEEDCRNFVEVANEMDDFLEEIGE